MTQQQTDAAVEKKTVTFTGRCLCGTHLFWMGDHGDKVDIAAGTLDDVSIFTPPDAA